MSEASEHRYLIALGSNRRVPGIGGPRAVLDAAVVAIADEGWEVQDGVYGHVEHSWLVHRGYRALLDTYAVGAFPPVKLVDPYGPEGRLYERRRSRNDIVRRHVTVMGWFKNTTSSGTSMFL